MKAGAAVVTEVGEKAQRVARLAVEIFLVVAATVDLDDDRAITVALFVAAGLEEDETDKEEDEDREHEARIFPDV